MVAACTIGGLFFHIIHILRSFSTHTYVSPPSYASSDFRCSSIFHFSIVLHNPIAHNFHCKWVNTNIIYFLFFFIIWYCANISFICFNQFLPYIRMPKSKAHLGTQFKWFSGCVYQQKWLRKQNSTVLHSHCPHVA
jgi:hypothetical protein